MPICLLNLVASTGLTLRFASHLSHTLTVHCLVRIHAPTRSVVKTIKAEQEQSSPSWWKWCRTCCPANIRRIWISTAFCIIHDIYTCSMYARSVQVEIKTDNPGNRWDEKVACLVSNEIGKIPHRQKPFDWMEVKHAWINRDWQVGSSHVWSQVKMLSE